jgi:cytochrome b
MSKKYLIWDLPLRLFHWCFAFTVFGCWYTAEQGADMVEIHMQLGFVTLGLILFRIVWGFVGTRHARFTQFIPSPKRLVNYLTPFKTNEASPGHNPLGALMIVVMILLVTAQAVSGLFINDDIFSAGPYYGTLTQNVEKLMFFIHHNTFDFMIAAIILHIFAVSYYWLIKKQNLIIPMITGKKSADLVKATDAISHSKLLLAIILVMLCAVFIYWLVVINVPVVEEYFY